MKLNNKISDAITRCRNQSGYSLLIIGNSLENVDLYLDEVLNEISMLGFQIMNMSEEHTEIRLSNKSLIVIELAEVSENRNYREILTQEDIVEANKKSKKETTVKYAMKNLLLFIVGYCLYITIEVTYRNISYPIMGVCGGLAIVILDKINDRISWDVDILIQGLCGSVLITLFELVIGEISIKTNILPIMWNYSNVPLNFDGVICLPFSIIWMALSIFAVFLADAINYYVLNENQLPYYKLFGKTIIRFKEK